MNPCLPYWNNEGEIPVASQKKTFGVDHDLVELLWQDGHVVLQSQNHTNKKVGFDDGYERRQLQIQEHDDQTMMRRSNLIQENENVSSWLHNSGPIDDDPFEKEFCSNFTLPEFHIQTNTPFDQNKNTKFQNPLPPPRYFPNCPKMMAQIKNNGTISPPSNGQHNPKPKATTPPTAPRDVAAQEIKECSVMTLGSSHCGSNQLAMSNNQIAIRGKEYYDVGKSSPLSEKETVEKAANTSSSGGSGSSFGGRTTYNQSTTTNSHKRKERDFAEDSESPSEAAGTDKSVQRSGNARRSRAAEVHNLSERRRRDRINEKMKALQELIPHSNKSDKASMLDEAIEYMKSLQIQLQMLWMGSGMAASMMFPSIQQQYLSRMGMSAAAMGSPSTLPALHNPMQQQQQHLPRMPMLDQTMATQIPPTTNQASLLNPVNYYNQCNTPNFQDQYAAFLGFQQLQNAKQPVNMFNFGSNAAQQNSNIAPPSHSNGSSL